MSVDATGVFLCLKHELTHMAKIGCGAIVNTASVIITGAVYPIDGERTAH